LTDNSPSTNLNSGPLTQIPCQEIGAIEAAVAGFNPVKYNGLGVNSNSFMHWLLGQFGISYKKPPGSKGWKRKIPGN